MSSLCHFMLPILQEVAIKSLYLNHLLRAHALRTSSCEHKGGTSYMSSVILLWVFLGLVEDLGSGTPCFLSQTDIEGLKI